MSAKIIDGKAIAADLRAKLGAETRRLTAAHGLVPGLAVVLVGDNAASKTYVASKARALLETGMRPFDHYLPADTSEADLLALIAKLNADPAVNGILVQLPLPPQINTARVVGSVSRRQGRRRFPSDQFRPHGGEIADACSLHADRLHQACQFGAAVARRARCAGRRPLQHRRQSARAIAARRQCNRDHRAYAYAQSAGPVPPRRAVVRRHRPRRTYSRRLDQAGRHRDRCRHQSRAGRRRQVEDRRRRVLCRGRQCRRRHHAGAGRRRPDDDRVLAGEYAARRLPAGNCRRRRFSRLPAIDGVEGVSCSSRTRPCRARACRISPTSAPPPCRRERGRIQPRSRSPTAPTRSATSSSSAPDRGARR